LTAVVSMTYRPLTPSSSLNLGGYWYRLSLTRGDTDTVCASREYDRGEHKYRWKR